MFADLKQLHVNNVSRTKATEKLENTSVVAKATSPDIMAKMVKKATGKFQKHSADVAFSKLLVFGFCST